MSSQVSARKALKDARQGKKFCFRSDHSEGFFHDLSVLFSLAGPLVTLASQDMYPFPREGILEDAQLAEQFILVRRGGVAFFSNEGDVGSGSVDLEGTILGKQVRSIDDAPNPTRSLQVAFVGIGASDPLGLCGSGI